MARAQAKQAKSRTTKKPKQTAPAPAAPVAPVVASVVAPVVVPAAPPERVVEAWWFSPADCSLRFKDGRVAAVGVTHEGPKENGQALPGAVMRPCHYGFHASERIIDALGYACGIDPNGTPAIWRVELSRNIQEHGNPVDKLAASKRKYLWCLPADAAELVLRRFAVWCGRENLKARAQRTGRPTLPEALALLDDVEAWLNLRGQPAVGGDFQAVKVSRDEMLKRRDELRQKRDELWSRRWRIRGEAYEKEYQRCRAAGMMGQQARDHAATATAAAAATATAAATAAAAATADAATDAAAAAWWSTRSDVRAEQTKQLEAMVVAEGRRWGVAPRLCEVMP